ncbi:MAG: Coenzyme F420 hydrogenase/dehydrogenase, beta subunit C-terminal domain [Clostridia bacterium]|nr:Coenzyme F420 hydrogenase/dehydrogenase, beta subunit C-terminal domain [Clostridia bacterium]
MKEYIAIERAEQCCGCGACVSACARDAITMKEDEAGFMYPAVDESLCVKCGRCKDVCVFAEKGAGANAAPQVYAAAHKNKNIQKTSSSGGLFSALAQAVLDKGGAVFGAAWAEDMTLAHICVQNEKELAKLRGSKYVQSMTGTTFREAKKMLEEGRYVCYSGTPCQIAGLKAYLGKDYENLLTVDIICHGVPSMKMLQDDLKYVAGENYSKITDVKFRDKRYGWGVKGSVRTADATLKYNAGTSPYYFYFLKGEVYRESCYHCRFPAEGRQGDITLGDYWGIRTDLIKKMGDVNPDWGISCVLVNNEKGKQWFKQCEKALTLISTDRQSVEKRNKQLTSASKPLPEHEELLQGYIRNGYAAYQSGYKKHLKDHIIRGIKNMIPPQVKRKINDILH